jgi:hypothetical protein
VLHGILQPLRAGLGAESGCRWPEAIYTLRCVARLSQHGLRRVLGTSALFSTAYGNVGSSIYYALGLVASYALGLTPIVFRVKAWRFTSSRLHCGAQGRSRWRA